MILRFHAVLIATGAVLLNLATAIAVLADDPATPQITAQELAVLQITAVEEVEEVVAPEVVAPEIVTPEVAMVAIVQKADAATQATVQEVALMAASSQAAPSSQPIATAPPAPAQSTAPNDSSTGDDRVLRRGLQERDYSIGYGEKLPFHRFDGRTDVHMIQLLPRYGKFQTAHREILFELPITIFTEPETKYAIGANIVLRQHLTKNRRFAPFIEIGPGVLFTNLRVPELGGSFQFSLQGGIGIRAALSAASDLIMALRWYHVSNAGLRSPNTGLNNSLFSVGYARLF